MMRKKSFRRFCALLLSAALMCSIFPMTVFADPDEEDTVEYIYITSSKNPVIQECTEYTRLSTVDSNTLSDGWYYLDADCAFTDRLTVEGDSVNLILGNGYTLTAEDGIDITADLFYIYSENGEGGSIVASSDTGSGIAFKGTYSKTYIHGGTIEAHGGAGFAGIGMGNDATQPISLTIEAGKVSAFGGANGAGIGSGSEIDMVGQVTVNGGEVLAVGGLNAAGFGGGYLANADNLFFFGGSVTARGNGIAPGIGGYNNANILYIMGDNLNLSVYGGESGGAAIGSAANADSFSGTIYLFEMAEMTAQGGPGGAGIGGGAGVASSASITVNPFLNKFFATISAGKNGQAIGDGAGATTGTTSIRYLSDNYIAMKDAKNALVLKENQAAALKGEKVTLQICDHPGAYRYEPQNYDGHYTDHSIYFSCRYCSAPDRQVGTDSHRFDSTSHQCICKLYEREVNVAGIDSSKWYLTACDDTFAPVGNYAVLRIAKDNPDREVYLASVTYTDPKDGLVKSIDDYYFTDIAQDSDENVVLSIMMPDADINVEVYYVLNVTFDANGATGGMDPDIVYGGKKYVLPNCGFTAPEGKIFAGWQINGSEMTYLPGSEIQVTDDMEVKALWNETVCEHEHCHYESTGDGHVKICDDCNCVLGAPEKHIDRWNNDDPDYAHWDGRCDCCAEEVWHVFFVLDESDVIPYKEILVRDGGKVEKVDDPSVDGKVFCGWLNTSGEFYDFDTAITKDTAIMAGWDLEVAYMKSVTVVFGAGFQLQFTMELSDALAADDGAYVEFLKGDTVVSTKKLDEPDLTEGGKVKYRVDVPLLEFKDDFTVKVYDGNGQPVNMVHPNGVPYREDDVCKYSIIQYARDIVTDENSSDLMIDLIKFLVGYYNVANCKFSGGEIWVPDEISNFSVSSEERAAYGVKTSGVSVPGVKGATMYLNFTARNTLRVMFTLDSSADPDAYTFKLDGHDVNYIDLGNNRYSIDLKDIEAPYLTDMHTFSISLGSDEYTITACALSYALLVIDNNPNDNAMSLLAKSFYWYGKTAKEYFDSLAG